MVNFVGIADYCVTKSIVVVRVLHSLNFKLDDLNLDWRRATVSLSRQCLCWDSAIHYWLIVLDRESFLEEIRIRTLIRRRFVWFIPFTVAWKKRIGGSSDTFLNLCFNVPPLLIQLRHSFVQIAKHAFNLFICSWLFVVPVWLIQWLYGDNVSE